MSARIASRKSCGGGGRGGGHCAGEEQGASSFIKRSLIGRDELDHVEQGFEMRARAGRAASAASPTRSTGRSCRARGRGRSDRRQRLVAELQSVPRKIIRAAVVGEDDRRSAAAGRRGRRECSRAPSAMTRQVRGGIGDKGGMPGAAGAELDRPAAIVAGGQAPAGSAASGSSSGPSRAIAAVWPGLRLGQRVDPGLAPVAQPVAVVLGDEICASRRWPLRVGRRHHRARAARSRPARAKRGRSERRRRGTECASSALIARRAKALRPPSSRRPW